MQDFEKDEFLAIYLSIDALFVSDKDICQHLYSTVNIFISAILVGERDKHAISYNYRWPVN